MKKVIKKDLKEYLSSLSEQERVEIRDTFLEMTGLSYPSWYNKISGRCAFSKLEIATLGNICKVQFVA